MKTFKRSLRACVTLKTFEIQVTWFLSLLIVTLFYLYSEEKSHEPNHLFHLRLQERGQHSQVVRVDKRSLAYKLLENPQSVCISDHVPLVLIIYHARPERRDRRDGIRDTWGKPTIVNGFRFISIFALGLPENQHDSSVILKEAKNFKDIIVWDFKDTLRNATLKTVLSLHWIKEFCNSAAYIFKTEDRLYVNNNILAEEIQKLGPYAKFVHAGIISKGNAPLRNSDKLHPEYETFIEEYPNKTFPTYISGRCGFMTPTVAALLYDASLRDKLLPGIEDAYLGILNKKYGLQLQYINIASGHYGTLANVCEKKNSLTFLLELNPVYKSYAETLSEIQNNKC